ncbi:phosphoethanolamine transferase [Bisgaard Taxon 10/6]|uniref:phosphoethanolamine transferase n=1 Tax=Exercitatus varius TaxID=67857 RepID=UPI00294B57EB|nr:phosphoethanolamine transferase [Exercitatus varius]MDG2915482.1 phosphoethanolamine transferase [Exercitatus varius]
MLTRLINRYVSKPLAKQILAAILALVCIIFASRLMLIGSGFFARPTVKQTLLMAVLFIIFNASKKLFWFVAFPFALLHALYAPIGLTFGPPSYQYIASVFATDLLESKEFLSQLPLVNFTYPVAIVALLWLFRSLTQTFHLHFYKNKMFLAAVAVFLIWGSAPLKFVTETYDAGVKVQDELTRLNGLAIESKWGKSDLSDAKYDDYVLIIGESARKDYLHAYGYPVNNTPFMSTAKGTLIDGFTAGGTNTIASLKLMLTKPDTKNWEGNYSLNLIDLIKSAGVKTYWISNQGYLGEFDTPISAIANKSDVKIFLKSGDSLNSNTSDFDLLPKFAQVIEQPAAGKRFIVLHLYGSHPITCDRLSDYEKIYNDYQIDEKYYNVNCYVSSMKKTDEVLKRVYGELVKNYEKSHRTFSMIYFSDHGLAQHETETGVDIHNSAGKSKRHYDIPLFKISSDDTQRHVYKVFKSGLNFTDDIAKWMGISNPQLNPNADLFSDQADPDDYGLKAEIEKITAPDDPAIVIPEKKTSE